jgi:sirohydrochlorin cobaltochelatase
VSREAVILLGHGSRQAGLGRPFASLQAWMQAELGPAYVVEDAYLSLSAPGLEESLAQLHARGLRRVSILPLFLVAGQHVSQDLPMLLRACAQRWPGLELRQAPVLGAFSDLIPVLRARLEQAGPACVPETAAS